MEDDSAQNPWITVSKKKRNRTSENAGAPTVPPAENMTLKGFLDQLNSVDGINKPRITNEREAAALKTNNFIDLSLNDDSSDDVDRNGAPRGSALQSSLAVSEIQSPPRKKSKKDSKKVCPTTYVTQKSHYPVIKVHATSINKQIGLTVRPLRI
jgi:hypothetical protein